MMRSCVGTILAMIVVVLTLGLARAPDRSKSTVDLLQLLSDARATALKSESPYVPPQALLEDICVTATRIGGATAVKLIEEIAADYQRAKLPPTSDGQLGKIAAQVAPYDARARDRILTLAANELRAALKVENLWKASRTRVCRCSCRSRAASTRSRCDRP